MDAASESNFLFPYPHNLPKDRLREVDDKMMDNQPNTNRDIVMQDENSLRELVKDFDDENQDQSQKL